jgi:hypothetical protein
MAALQKNGILTTLTNFFLHNGYNKVQERYLVTEDKPQDGVLKLQIDFFVGRPSVDSSGALIPSRMFDRYARMGRKFGENNNILVIKNVEVEVKGLNLVENAAIELLLSDPSIDIIVLEDIQDPAWKTRLLSGKDGRRRWVQYPMGAQDNVYLSKEQVARDFLGGKSKRYRKRYSKKRKSRKYKN